MLRRLPSASAGSSTTVTASNGSGVFPSGMTRLTGAIASSFHLLKLALGGRCLGVAGALRKVLNDYAMIRNLLAQAQPQKHSPTSPHASEHILA